MTTIKVIDAFCIPAETYKRLEDFGKITIAPGYMTDEEEIINSCAGADILILSKTQLTSRVLNRLKNIKLICLTASGFDNVDVEAARELGIPVCNIPGYGSTAVAEHVFALLFAMVRKIVAANNQVKENKWINVSLQGQEITGKTIGIVGFGQIGQTVSKMAQSFSMKVLAYTHNPDKYKDQYPEITFVSLEELMKSSDIVTIHVPHNKETDKLINTEMLGQMKPNAILINTSRGKVLDEQALIQALKERKIRACVDVLDPEPPFPDNEILTMDNILITPHTAWYTEESVDRLMDILYGNIKNFLDGKPENVVN